ncbi:MAG: HAMP domain-containing histidine kinase, partial [Ruminococcus sp.]|nr:HAMP domain-containing histidine kinase [Ruminococcus sp.]
LSKLESGNAELKTSQFAGHDFLNDVMKRYNILIERDGYNIELITDEDRLVTADYDKMSQVLYNFINNAVNYSGDSKDIQVKQTNKGSNVRIEIIDHGIGISKEMLPVVFDRYYRGNKTQREVVGSGIGLSIVKGILKSHELPFGVMSEEGKGSTFWFEFTNAKNTDNSDIAVEETKKKRSKQSKNR